MIFTAVQGLQVKVAPKFHWCLFHIQNTGDFFLHEINRSDVHTSNVVLNVPLFF